MGFVVEERTSDSPYLESIIHGRTSGNGAIIRPSEVHCHLVFTKFQGETQSIFVGPLTSAGKVSFIKGIELLWIKFRVGTFISSFLPGDFRDTETILPDASNHSFWLKNTIWDIPDYDNVETFIGHLVHDELLSRDPLVEDVLEGNFPDISPRTVRFRFQQATGLTRTHIYQFERALEAESLLLRGVPIIDVVTRLGYFDQPHLTRSLKRFFGRTPGEIAQMGKSDSM